MFRQIIVGVDGSEKTKKATRVACDLAKHYSGTVTLIHVLHVETGAFTLADAPDFGDVTDHPSFHQLEKAGVKVLKEVLNIASDFGLKAVKTHMPHGDAATEILLHADEIAADLIITGRRGLSGISSMVLGSTTQRINHLAKCACLSML